MCPGPGVVNGRAAFRAYQKSDGKLIWQGLGRNWQFLADLLCYCNTVLCSTLLPLPL